MLAFATFVYDTLDVCTRLARYLFVEFTGWRTKTAGIVGTVVSLAIPAQVQALFASSGWDTECAEQAVAALAAEGDGRLGFNAVQHVKSSPHSAHCMRVAHRAWSMAHDA